MINTAEAYGCTRPIGVFCEQFGKLKSNVQQTSSPLTAITTRYPGLWPVTLNSSEGQKLVIGTTVSDMLITSTIHLDVLGKLSVGGVTTMFTLDTVNDSNGCKIFLDRLVLEKALEIIDTPNISRLSNSLIMSRTRAIRTKFHTPDA